MYNITGQNSLLSGTSVSRHTQSSWADPWVVRWWHSTV